MSTTTGHETAGSDRDRTQLLGAIDAISDVIESNADLAQRERSLPAAAWQAIDDAGLFALKAPRELGGFEADPMLQMEIIERLSYLDSSAGWSLMVGCGAQAMAGGWAPEQSLELLMDGSRLRRGAIVMAPTGQATAVEGGYQLSGRWQFGSGVLHAEWVLAGAHVTDVDGTKEATPRTFLLPLEAVTVHDNWHVGGLRGTGSNDFSVEDIFVPSEHTWSMFSAPRRGGTLYRLGLPEFVACEHAGLALGLGRRAIDEMITIAKTKTRGPAATTSTASRGHFQHQLGTHDIALRAARDYAFARYQAAWDRVAAGETLAVPERLELRITASHVTTVALNAAQAMFRYAGAKSLYEGSVIERCMRDLNAAAQHQMLNDALYEEHGKALLGLPDVSPFV